MTEVDQRIVVEGHVFAGFTSGRTAWTPAFTCKPNYLSTANVFHRI